MTHNDATLPGLEKKHRIEDPADRKRVRSISISDNQRDLVQEAVDLRRKRTGTRADSVSSILIEGAMRILKEERALAAHADEKSARYIEQYGGEPAPSEAPE